MTIVRVCRYLMSDTSRCTNPISVHGDEPALCEVHRGGIDPRHLVGIAEIGALFLVGRSTASNWNTRADLNGFPEPVKLLASGPIFDVRAVLDWYRGYVPVKGSRPGRMPGAATIEAALDGRIELARAS